MSFIYRLIRSDILQIKLLFVLSSLVFLSHLYIVKSTLYSDIRFYWATARSVVIDHDFDLSNEFYELGITNSVIPNVKNQYPIGASLFMVPALFYQSAFSNMLSTIGIKSDTSGYGINFQIAASIRNILLTALGFLILKKTLEHYFSKEIAFYTAILSFLGTNVFFYSAIEPLMSHSASFFVSTLFVYVFFTQKESANYYKKLGLIAGLAGLIRTQDLLLLSLPAIKILLIYRKKLSQLVTCYLLLVTYFLLSFSPQILYWKYFYDTFWHSPFLNVGFNFGSPKILHVLFNSQNGAFTITPVYLLGIIGTTMSLWQTFGKLKRENLNISQISNLKSQIFIYVLIFFILQLYLVSSWNDSQGGSFGIRMLVSTMPFLAFGLANLMKAINQRFGGSAVMALSGFIIILNQILIVRYLLRF